MHTAVCFKVFRYSWSSQLGKIVGLLLGSSHFVGAERPFEKEILEIFLYGIMEIGGAQGHSGAKESSSLLQLYSSEYEGW